MDFSKNHRTNCKVTLDSRIELFLDELFQDRVYYGIIEGAPRSDFNDRYIDGYLKSTTELVKKVTQSDRFFFINPPRYKRVEGYPNDVEFIPGIFCRAYFSSSVSAEKDMIGSHGYIIWFQTLYALPIQEDILQKIKSMDWFLYSSDIEY